MTTCPVCDGSVPTDTNTLQGELIECPECGAEFEVTGTDPITLEEAPQEEEDWGE